MVSRKTQNLDLKAKGVATLVYGTFVAFLLFCQSAYAVDLLEYQLKELSGTEVHDLGQYRGDTVVMIFFQPDCPFCVKQSRVLNQIQEECEDFQAIAVGVNGSRSDLQVELREMRASYPAYEISPALQSQVGKVVGTPLMLIGDKKGNFTSHLQGYQQMDAIIPVLGEAGLSCTSPDDA